MPPLKLHRAAFTGAALAGMFLTSPVSSQSLDGTHRRVAVNPSTDLLTLLAESSDEATDAIPFGPRLVAGEGPHPDAHTLVRVFDRHGVAESQFLAFPVSVQGGVQVEAGSYFPPDLQIAAVPFEASGGREVRLFHQDGRTAGSFEADSSLTPPLVIASGDFLPDAPGAELAVTSRFTTLGNRKLFLYNGDGDELARLDPPMPYSGQASQVHLARVPEEPADLLVVQYVDDEAAVVYEPLRHLSRNLNLSNLSTGVTLHPSAHPGDYLAGGGEEPLSSSLHRFGALGAVTTIDAGWRENRFWIDPVDEAPVGPDGLVFTFDSWEEGWTQTSAACSTSHEDGDLVIRYINAAPFDPYFFGPTMDLDASQFTEFAMRIDLTGGPVGTVTGALYYYPEAGGVGSVPFTFFAGVGSQVVRLNIPGLAPATPWSGMISRVRIDLPNLSASYPSYQNAEARIDWVSITADPQHIPLEGQNAIFSEYVRPMAFRHIRTDANSDNYPPPVDFETTDPEDWIGPGFQAWKQNSQAPYFTGPDSVWEPTFSHRQFVGPFEDWRDAIDSDTGLPRYAALTRLDNYDTYEEVGNSFETMTWSPGLPELERLLVWPLRDYLQSLAPLFRQDPTKMVALEPNHEFEINITGDDSIGDYNPAMVRGFRDWLVRRYTTLTKINARMGTNFASISAIDPPRDTGRGGWDAYNSGNPFLLAWVDYLRSVVNWRIAQGMREALLAGFPPEIIKTHQIPANYAVGAAETSGRITPVDWAMTTGTGFGGTRYSIWYNRASNWVQGAFDSGHSMIACGEYHPLTTNQSAATAQLQYMFDHGVHFIHHMTWDNSAFNEVGVEAYRALAGENRPRPGTTGGVRGLRPAVHYFMGTEYRGNIVQVGGYAETAGLLKSVGSDGRWDGLVYLTPFHSRIGVEARHDEEQRILAGTDIVTAPITGLYAGDQIEISFLARTDDADGQMTILSIHDGIEFAGTRTNLPVGPNWTSHRYVLTFQDRMDGVQFIINSGERDTPTWKNQEIELDQFSLVIHRRQAARHEYGVSVATPHRGGVSFDTLSPEYRADSLGISRFNDPVPNAWRVN